MGKYTIELKTIMESESIRPFLDNALSTYPMYTPLSNNPEVLAIIPTRDVLNKKILNHYKYYEIGFESVARFLDELQICMEEIMPFYNQMYNTCEIMAKIDDPFGNVDVTETFKQTTTGSSSSENEGSTSSNSKDISTNTPQGNVISITSKNMDAVTHADSVGWNKGSTEDNSKNTSSSSGTTEHTFTKKGNQGVNTYAHDMVEFRTSIIDVTTQIINDQRVRELFMQVF